MSVIDCQTSTGRAFSAGADLKAKGVETTPRHGLGVGIGCTILGLADNAFAAQSARFRCPFSSLGITAEAASNYTFTRLMGHKQANWILLSAEWVDAKMAGS